MAIERAYEPITVIKNILIFLNLLILLFLIPTTPGSQDYYSQLSVLLVSVLATFFSLIAIFLHWYNNIVFDRVMLSLYLYLIVKSMLSMKYDLLHTHFIFPVLIAVGLYTTFLTEAGFIGLSAEALAKEDGVDKKSVFKMSLALLSIVAFVWLCAYQLRWPGQIAMFLVVGWAYGALGRQMLSAQLSK
jgi:hypothetical protein